MIVKTNNDWAVMSNSTIIGTIGMFVKHKRLENNKSQSELAKESGVNRWTLGQIEKGESITLTSLIQILRALNLLHLMNIFTIEDSISPIEYARLKEKKRLRARKKSKETDSKDDIGW